jgi:hypothetical protein
MSSGYNYSPYVEFVKLALTNDDLFQRFKRDSLYREILEHVTPEQGAYYLRYCWEFFSLDLSEILRFTTLNDRQGEPLSFTYGPITCSPSSLRYIFQSHLILQHMKSLGLSEVSIVELGCGYGGLLLAVATYAEKFGIKIREYSCVDLDGILNLQERYVSAQSLSFPVRFLSAATFGKDVEGSDLFFISCYCFSEISSEFQTKYCETLLPKCSHGFLAWNMIDLYDFGKTITVQDEIPLTGPKNKFVYF